MKTLPIHLPNAFSPSRKTTRRSGLKSILTGAVSLLMGLSAIGSGGSAPKTGTTTTGYRLSVSKAGNDTVTVSPAGATFMAGTAVTLTATPGAGATWKGWSGPMFGNFAVGGSQVLTVTMNGNIWLQANFK